MLGIAVIAIATMVVVTVMLISDIRNLGDVIVVLLLGVSLAVAAVPEGLPTILSVVLAMGVQRMARRNAVVKELSSVETLGSCSVICTDKTGTLTRAEMTIERVMTASGGTRISGVGYLPEGRADHQVRFPEEGMATGTGTHPQADLPEGSARPAGAPVAAGAPLPADVALLAEDIVVLSGGSLAGNADLRRAEDGSWQIQGDPTEAAFLVAERKLGLTERRLQRFERIRELPFTSERKMMSVIGIDHEHEDEAVLISKGAPDVLLQRCSRIRQGMSVVPLDDVWRSRVFADIDALSDAALRTLAVAIGPWQRTN
jgi:magnesium-transporting ATPase (P-type)